MEPYPKRQRLYSPIQRGLPRSFDDRHAYYGHREDELAEEEDYEEFEEEDEEPIYDPDVDFHQRRAHLDYKLKSTFEAIFEKYGKDFDGVGDEIDLETGDIVVNNGHLLDMQDERDAGRIVHARHIRQELLDETEEDFSTSMEEDEDELLGPGYGEEDEDEDEDEDEVISGDDMEEDDLILRGFAQASSQFMQASPELGTANQPYQQRDASRLDTVPRPNIHSNSLPSRSEILSQFGPQLGPQIVKYVSNQVPDDSHIEPAWRVPELPSAAPVRRPILKSVAVRPEVQRSPSPEAGSSIWAPVRTRRRRRIDGRDNEALFRGETSLPEPYYDSHPLDPFTYRSAVALGKRPEVSRRYRRQIMPFTAEEDRILLDWVSKARQRDISLNSVYLNLEKKYSHRPWYSWRDRYRSKFTYLFQNEESDLSTTDTSMEGSQIPIQKGPRLNYSDDMSYGQTRPAGTDRPNRIRKPAQRDSRIISWSDAVNDIESLDPDLHAGILEDIRQTKAGDASWTFHHPIPSSSRQSDAHRLSLNRPNSSHQVDQHRRNEQQQRQPERRFSDNHLPKLFITGSSSSFADQNSLVRAPCPHADCRYYPKTFYRLQSRDGEDLSQMCLHLLDVHHTTPYPCGEQNCERKGERGYFLPADLDRHVKATHPHVGTLHRLRGRVDPELLDQHSVPASRESRISNPQLNRPESRQKESDFMSQRVHRVPSSSEDASLSPDLDRTLTPEGTMGRFGGDAPSTSTPLTSVSSMKVNHSSATNIPLREISDSQERLDIQTDEEISWREGRHREQVGESVPPISQDSSSRGASLSQGRLADDHDRTRATLPKPDESLIFSGAQGNKQTARRDGMETAASTENTSRGTNGKLLGKATSGLEPSKIVTGASAETTNAPREEHQREQPVAHKSSPPRVRPSIGATIPNSQSSLGETLSSSLPTSKASAVSGKSRVTESFSRNTIDPSYEFSDEEMDVVPAPEPAPPSAMLPPRTIPRSKAKPPLMNPVTGRPNLVAPARPTVPTAATTSKPRISEVYRVIGQEEPALATPVKKSKPRKSVVRRFLGQEDVDELTNDDFVLISSHSKSTPHATFGSQSRIKREETIGPQNLSVGPAEKRKLRVFQRSDEVDELASPDGLDSLIKPRIKKEVDLSGTPMVHRIKPKPNESKGQSIATTPAAPLSSSPSQIRRPKNVTTTSTPLLDLTPSCNRNQTEIKREIDDSGVESSIQSSSQPGLSQQSQQNRSRDQREIASSSSPLVGLLTPSRKQRWNGDPTNGQPVAVVVKTPGGSLRRCGEDGFRCGRSFCFRCGSTAASAEA